MQVATRRKENGKTFIMRYYRDRGIRGLDAVETRANTGKHFRLNDSEGWIFAFWFSCENARCLNRRFFDAHTIHHRDFRYTHDVVHVTCFHWLFLSKNISPRLTVTAKRGGAEFSRVRNSSTWFSFDRFGTIRVCAVCGTSRFFAWTHRVAMLRRPGKLQGPHQKVVR